MGLGILGLIDREERLKIFFLGLSYFLIITAYTVAKEFKDSVFVNIVGKDYIPMAKIVAMFALIPAIFLYAKLVDKIRRYQLLCVYSLFFGIVGLIFTVLLGNSIIGLPNTNTSKYRIFGWLFYIFVEGYSPFMVSVFWAFANSINSPNSAKKSYGLLVSASKIGGMLSAGLGWFIFSTGWLNNYCAMSDVGVHQLLFGFSSVVLLFVPASLLLLMKKVSGRHLHGYEAAYRLEKEKAKEEKVDVQEKEHLGIFRRMLRQAEKLTSGFILLIKYPYVFGIFCMVFFYEVIATVLSFLRIGVAQANASTMGAFTGNLFKLIFISHFIGFIISLLGTSTLLRALGERRCLLLIPTMSGIFAVYMIMSGLSPFSVGLAFVAIKSINYAFSWPVRESLYIPTVKEIKFKSKSWIDAFGSKFAKSSGSTFNMLSARAAGGFFFQMHALFFGGLIILWTIAAWLLGKRYERAIMANKVIGSEK